MEEGYWEVRMINNDLFKAKESPDGWERKDIRQDAPNNRGFIIFQGLAFTDIRNGKMVVVNPDLIASIREVSEPGDTTVGLIADDQFVRDTSNLAGAILGSFLGGTKKAPETIDYIEPEKKEVD